MTIIVGIALHNDQILMASDSQTTDGNRKRLDARKIHTVRFGRDTVLIAESGFSELSSRAIAMVRERAANTEIATRWTVADICQQVLSEIRAMMCAGFPSGFTVEGLQTYIEREREFSLTVAHFWDYKPYLFTISNANPVAAPKHGSTITNGCGADLAEYILSEHYDKKINFGAAVALSVYVVEKVKQTNPFCGGPTQLALIQSYSKQVFESLNSESPGSQRSFGYYLPNEWATKVASQIPSIEAHNKLAMRMSMMMTFGAVLGNPAPPPMPSSSTASPEATPE